MAIRGKHEGSIYRKPNGSWVAQVSIDGRRISHVAKTHADCHAWIRQMLDQIDHGFNVETRNLTVSGYLREWMAIKKRTLRARTAFEYERHITRNIEPLLGKVLLKDLSVRLVNQFYDKLLQQGVAASNVRYAHRILHAALEQAAKTGLIPRNAAHGATLPKKQYREMAILNEQQVTSFLVAANASRFKALFHLAVTTGMRFSELRGLSWSDVDWIKGTIAVKRQIIQIPGLGATAGEPKTRSGIRTIRLGETTLEILREQQRRIQFERMVAGDTWKENDLIFPSKVGTPFIPASVKADLHDALKAANLPHIRFHDLRHTAASLMLSHGVPVLVVSKMLGHSSPSVTLGIYAHSTLDMQDQAASVMDQIVSPVLITFPDIAAERALAYRKVRIP